LRRPLFIIVLGLWTLGCTSTPEDDIRVFNSSYDFNDSQYEWSGDFTDYKIRDSSQVKFQFLYTNVPTNTPVSQRSLVLSGINTSDDLFLFIKKKITGLKPDTEYTIAFDVEMTCNSDKQSKDTLVLKAGASAFEPQKIIQGEYYRMNLDKGATGANGVDMIVIGKVGLNANNISQEYGVIQSGIEPSAYLYVKTKTNSEGDIWLILGTESIYAGVTTIYFTKAAFTFSVSD